VQTGALAINGQLTQAALVASIPLTLLAVAMMALGWRIQNRIDAKTYKRMLRVFLWAMALGLAAQSGWRLVAG